MCWLWHAADGQRVEIARSQAPADGIEGGAQLVKQSPSAAAIAVLSSVLHLVTGSCSCPVHCSNIFAIITVSLFLSRTIWSTIAWQRCKVALISVTSCPNRSSLLASD